MLPIKPYPPRCETPNKPTIPVTTMWGVRFHYLDYLSPYIPKISQNGLKHKYSKTWAETEVLQL